MVKLKENKGFTLAELLIVVAIIGVLVAISIPIFTQQLRKARIATNQSNARAAYAAVTSDILFSGVGDGVTYTYDVATSQLTRADGSTESGGIYTDDPDYGSIAKWSTAGPDDLVANGKDIGDAIAIQWKVYVNDESVVEKYFPVWD